MADEPLNFILRVSIEKDGTALYLNYLLECKAGTEFGMIREQFAKALHGICKDLDLRPELQVVKFGVMSEVLDPLAQKEEHDGQ